MSADLWAAFGASTQSSTSSASQNTAQDPSDPFSLFSFEPTVLQSQEQNLQRSSTTTTTPTPSSPWTTSTASQQRASTGWGDLSAFGSLGGSVIQARPSQVTQQQSPTVDDDDEGWGEFEVAQANPPPPFQPAPVVNNDQDKPRTRPVRAPTIDMLTNRLVDVSLESPASEPWQQRPSWETERPQQPKKPAVNPDPNVLFDADFENGLDEDDDFGEFETGKPASALPDISAPAKPSIDLLSLELTPTSTPPPAQPKKQPAGLTLSNAGLNIQATLSSGVPKSPYPEAPKSPYGSFQERKPDALKELQVKTPTATSFAQNAQTASPSPVTAWPSIENDSFCKEWEEFKDLPDPTDKSAPSKSTAPKSNAASKAAASDWEDWQEWTTPKDTATVNKSDTSDLFSSNLISTPSVPDDKPGPPPTNIPPPAILLSLFPSLLDLTSAPLLKPLLTLPPSSPTYRAVVSSPKTLTFLRGYLALATVAARIMAGRKLRWHRDKFLAQGMSISAATGASRGGRGMKLAGLDKSQVAREDGETAEVLAVWKDKVVGRLRGVVAAVNAAQKLGAETGERPLRVPEMGGGGVNGFVVSTAKGVPTAPKPCVVCGLRRDERVAKVDVDVEDLFGEWWVEFWGHRECRNFWLEHEKELRSR
ncbi:putative transcription initiation factor [Thermochaetoides thermophila DSM 1495]|uniref:Putative transcription initiation factor n=1 Tax=Chaetomium thermophilum (strain DSM 1495 / CBS 144.50 / IMI 039719) TaxID=759272 RepID=G0S528_CHATD|nr:putative transcription initiation factor [Thermochaetoides thermophila DSM 1495]EGS20553.1 putative transcription initiation factor [Thermochaetoides thermophila DSM 1495]